MRKITLIVCTLAGMLTCTLSANAQWRQTSGPNNKAVNSIAVSGSSIYAGTYGGGVYKSTNNGATWTTKNIGLTFPYVNALMIDGSTIFAGTDGGGVFVSTNGGNWVAKNSGLTGSYVSAFTVSESYIFATTKDNGIFLSKDLGNSWTAVDSNVTSSYFYSIAAKGADIYAGTNGDGLFFSKDTGTAWFNTGPVTEVYSLAISGSNVYAGNNKGVALTQDSGEIWTTVDSGLTVIDTVLTYDYAANNGIGKDTISVDTVKAPIYSLQAYGSDILAGSYGNGVFVTTNSGKLWTAFNSGGLANSQIYSLAVNDSFFFAGTTGGLVWRRPLSDLTTCVPAITTSGLTTVCQGDSVTLTVTSGSAYLWNTGATTQSIEAKATGNYSCLVNTTCGELASNIFAVTINPAPSTAITASGNTTFCQGGSVTLSVAAGADSSYLWNNNLNSTTSSITVSNSQVYTVTVIGANRCKASSSIQVTSVPFPTVTTQPKSQNVVAGCFTSFVAGDTAANQTFQWQANVGFGFNNLSNSGFYSGTNTDTLTVSNVSVAMSGYSYRCILSNSICTDTTSSAVLTVHSPSTTSHTITLCSGDSLTVGAHTYTTSGTYTDTLLNVAGCDSIVLTSNLTLNSTIRNTQNITLCTGDSLTLGLYTYSATGTYVDTVQAGIGCDSIVTTHLSFNPTIRYSQTDTLCAGDSLIVGPFSHSTSGTYIDTLHAGVSCDSIVTTKLFFKVTTIGSRTDTSVCAGGSVMVSVHTYDSTGVYIDTFQNAAGCDSVHTTYLTVLKAIADTQTVTLCSGNNLTVGIHTYNTSGTYTDNLISAVHGCDSTVTTILTIDSIIHVSQTDSLCAGGSVTVGSFTHSSSGTYIDTLYAGVGCDSIVTTHLTINPVMQDSVVIHIDSLVAAGTAGTYQWIDCGDPGTVLATTRSYFPRYDGNYKVIVTQNGCTDTSACKDINVGIAESILNYSITIYPNPATSTLDVQISSAVKGAVTLQMYDALGRDVFGRTQVIPQSSLKDYILNIQNLQAGIYFVQVRFEDGNIVKRFVKE